jgi:hypothetical protein
LKSSQWSMRNICSRLVEELVENVTSRSVTRNFIDEDRVVGDICDKIAYLGGGSWWIDRWIPARTGSVPLEPAGVVDHGEKMAMGFCSVYEHIIRPKELLCRAYNLTRNCHNPTNAISCSGLLKRKSRTRSGCWWPGSGSTAFLRRPWQSTIGAGSRLDTWRKEFELIGNQARIGQEEEILNDKFQCLFIPRAKESIITGVALLVPITAGKKYREGGG